MAHSVVPMRSRSRDERRRSFLGHEVETSASRELLERAGSQMGSGIGDRIFDDEVRSRSSTPGSLGPEKDAMEGGVAALLDLENEDNLQLQRLH